MNLFLAVEVAIPADHPAAILAVPLGLLFFGGSVILLLWSNYGIKKASAMYGVAFFGFGALIGVFFWFGGPGVPANLGITHLPGATPSDYAPTWYGFEPGSERAEFFDVTDQPEQFEEIVEFLGFQDLTTEELNREPSFASLSGDVGSAIGQMQDQYLPVDDNGIAQIGSERRAELEDAVVELEEQEPEVADATRAPTFYTADPVGEPRITEDPDTGLRVIVQDFQTMANFVDDEGVPVLTTGTDNQGEEIETPWPVSEPEPWFAFNDPGQRWFPSMVWTVVSLIGFGISLFFLDKFEMLDKRRAAEVVEEPEDLAVPIAQ